MSQVLPSLFLRLHISWLATATAHLPTWKQGSKQALESGNNSGRGKWISRLGLLPSKTRHWLCPWPFKVKSKGTNLQNKKQIGKWKWYNCDYTGYEPIQSQIHILWYGFSLDWRMIFTKCRKNNHKLLEWLKLPISCDNKLGKPGNLSIVVPIIKTILQQMHSATLGRANWHTSYANDSCNQTADHPRTLMRCQM